MAVPMCRDCFTGTLRGDIVPKGREETIHGLPTYVASPDAGVESLGTVVIIPDAFGWEILNTRALADAYARRVPCTVYVPDFMQGHGLPIRVMDLMEFVPPPTDNFLVRFLKRSWAIARIVPPLLSFIYYNRTGKAHPRVLSFFRALRSSPEGATIKIGTAGFCWGGLHAVLLAGSGPEYEFKAPDASTKPLIDCAFTAHPSLLKVPAHLELVVRPLSVANGDDDEYMGKSKMETLKRVLEDKNTKAGSEIHEVVVYPGAKHGFAVRGDWEEPLQKEMGAGSEDQAVRWFRGHFSED